MILNQANFKFNISTNIEFGKGVVKYKSVEVLEDLNAKNILIVSDKALKETQIFKDFINFLRTKFQRVEAFTDVDPNPSVDSVIEGTKLYKDIDCDCIIGFGGGSSIDVAKAINISNINSGDIINYGRGGKEIKGPLQPLIIIPTTAGTGSEVTGVSVITDKKIKRKFVLASQYVKPDYALIDPLMIKTLPKNQLAFSGIDALVHAIEAYTNKKSQPISDALALQSIKMLVEYLPKAYSRDDDIESYSQVILASTMAGMAFSESGVGLVHSVSHAVSSHFNVPHGLANAVILPYIIEYNFISEEEKYTNISRVFASICAKKESEYLPEQLKEFTEKFSIPDDFSYLNKEITDNNLEALIQDTIDDKGTYPNNPRAATAKDIKNILNELFPSYSN